MLVFMKVGSTLSDHPSQTLPKPRLEGNLTPSEATFLNRGFIFISTY